MVAPRSPSGLRVFRPQRVTRPDAGGVLWAPVDQQGREHGVTPSYSPDAVARFCETLFAECKCDGETMCPACARLS